ncbi:MAG: F0F1 ATP synthase subunit B [Anaerolineae bacterium]
MEALGINLGYLVSQIVNFAILALFLYFVGYKPVLRMMDERRARIEKGLQDAAEASRRAAEAQEEFARQMAEAKREAQEILAQATAQGEKAREEILAQARAEAQELLERAKEEIRLEREQAFQELQRQVADLTILVSSKVLGEVVDEERQRRLIREFLEQAERL